MKLKSSWRHVGDVRERYVVNEIYCLYYRQLEDRRVGVFGRSAAFNCPWFDIGEVAIDYAWDLQAALEHCV